MKTTTQYVAHFKVGNASASLPFEAPKDAPEHEKAHALLEAMSANGSRFDFDYVSSVQGTTRAVYRGVMLLDKQSLRLPFEAPSYCLTWDVDAAFVAAYTTYGALRIEEEPARADAVPA